METINSKTEFSNIVEKWNSTNSGLLKINNFDIFGKKINTCISFDNIIIKIMTDLTEFFVISDEMNNEKYDFLNIKLISNFKKKKWVIIFDIIFEFIKKNRRY